MKLFQSSKISLALVGTLIFAVVASAVEDTWTQKANMPTARTLSTCELNGKIYAIGGSTGPDTSLSAVEEYDPATDKWARRANLPEARCDLSTSAVDGKIYAIGGGTSPVGGARSSVYVYDPPTDTWTRKADMPTARMSRSAGVVNGKIYVIGGAPSPYSPAYRTVEEYDPATDTWTRKADMPTARTGHSAGVVDGKIYAIGGMVGGPTPWTALSVVEAYDPATNTWTRKADMPTRRFAHSVSAVDGKIYAIGGYSGSAVVSTVEEYDAATDTWRTKTPMPTALWGLSTSAVGAKIYAVGGARTVMAGSAVSTVQEYDTGLTILPPESWSLGGSWIETCVATGRPVFDYATLTPQNSAGNIYAFSMYFVNADHTLGGIWPEADGVPYMFGTAVRTGLNTCEYTVVGHAAKSNRGTEPPKPPEVLGTVVFSGKLTVTGPDTMVDTGCFMALYGPDADVNPADGLPDEGAAPFFCYGPLPDIPGRRIGLMAPCTPIP